MDEIKIKGLKIYGHHGVFEFEKTNGQFFYLNVTMKLETQEAGLTDDLTKSVSYADVCADIEKLHETEVYNLIETAAESTAYMILEKYSLVQSVTVEVCKPEAPVSQEVQDLSVCITRKRHQVFVAYGSNMGDSKTTIESALEDIEADRYCKLVKKSTMVISKPYGGVEQADYHNGVVEIETYYEPESLLDFLQTIEYKYGRTREIHWGPRTLDLDIILYDDMIINSKRLNVPHPDMASRDFVLGPLAEIAGYKLHPVTRRTMSAMAADISEKYIK